MLPNSKPMSDERIAEIKAREQLAMEGPYSMFGCEMIREPRCMDGWEPLGIQVNDSVADGATLTFLCHSRQDIPDLLAEVERLRGIEAELRKDRERLDWLEHPARTGPELEAIVDGHYYGNRHHSSLRAAIDAALQVDNQPAQEQPK